MLHLDQNHSTLSSPHAKPNLILPSTARPDQHPLRSWPGHDEKPIVQEQQDPAVGEHAAIPPIKPDVPGTNTETPPEPAAATGSTAPGNAEDPKVEDQSPHSPADATSPAIESTSSLTPPPSTTSPAFSSVDLPDGETTEQQKVEGSEVEDKSKAEASAEAAEKPSRASTPLSELSSAPEGDEPSAGDKKESEEKKAGADAGGSSTTDAAARAKDAANDASNGDIKLSAAPVDFNVASAHMGQVSVSRAQSIATPEPAANMAMTSSMPRKTDPKVDVMIELNAELLRVCMELQARGIPLADLRAQQYASRLQSNLTWMAAAADEHRKFSVHSMPLPPLQAPQPLDFPSSSVERIQQIYAELPAMFSRDGMRRVSGTGSGIIQPPGLSNGNLKRERSDDASAEHVGTHKRRDTGESKASTPVPVSQMGSASSPLQLQSTGSPAGQPGTPTHPMGAPGMMGSSSSSPSMPPPSVPPGVAPNMNEAQIAAARARQMQMRQAAMQQGLGDAGRQMSAGSQGGMGMPNMAGASSIPPQQLAALQQMGPGAVQCFQILQNPQHPLVQYMIQNVPGFQSAPPVQQIQQMQRVQAMMQAKSQQQRAANAQAGFPQGPGGMGVPNGSPTRMSPSGQQTPMQQQGGFQFPGGGGQQNAMSLTPAQQANLANMNPQQRQLFLMQHQQQQQIMRGGNNPNSAMMNQQMFNAAQQQRMAGASPHIGSPMLGGPGDGSNFPAALRSNPGVPGIARSARTPSDHASSPMTPQISQGRGGQMDDFQRAMMAQRNLQGGGMNQLAGGNMNASWPQSQGMVGQGMSGAMSPPGSAGFVGMPGGGSPSIGGQQQWSPNNASGQFPFNARSPSAGPQGDISISESRQTSATPAPMAGMAQNSPMPGGDQGGLNDFDIFDWTQ
ncbi:hypothetical protein PsYK624_008770 [Phanerochaete sordida]|uniref:Uncharacterized protein n=1 Tax=Phanerochaete sordida TaxID=48140 RepID=A0A9P3FY94_9APHY|nr:hypothetical protein PsYK624_008770 [Phanerochaete sordida]